MGSLFGTDGVRGSANGELTPELALALGRALVAVLREDSPGRPAVIIGRDPRWSGEMIEAALVAGIASAGGDVRTVGVLPTAAVAQLTLESSAAAGAMISASHNLVGDNGIKFFGGDGFKLSDDQEARLEAMVENVGARPRGTEIGRRTSDPAAVARYVEHLTSIAAVDLSGIRVVVDGANGAASRVAPQVYRQLGADVVPIHCSPDGANINRECGSTHPEVLCAAVVEHRAHVGISHDGDADRLVASTADGDEVDGDVILAVLAGHAHEQGRLPHGAVATTVMTNLGFRRAMSAMGIDVVETPVGDRYVLQAMRDRGLRLGGEQSGHLIDLASATTGDGILSAVRLLTVMRETGASLAELATVMRRLPRVLVNVDRVDRTRLADAEPVWEAVRAEQERLGGSGRILLRPSGTEPVVRVMVEAETERTSRDTADRIAQIVRDHLAAS